MWHSGGAHNGGLSVAGLRGLLTGLLIKSQQHCCLPLNKLKRICVLVLFLKKIIIAACGLNPGCLLAF